MSDLPKQPTYPPPVDLLLVYGDARKFREWPDYLSLGFTEEHVPDLIRMALDPELNWADSESLVVWAPIHAWRTLGQLRAQAAIEPLLALFHMFEEDGGSDWTSSDLPQVYALIGAAAIPALSGYLLNESHGEFPRADAAATLKRIAEEHPDFRSECVAALVTALEKFETNGESLNALLIGDLVDLKATEALPVIERAFAADTVDLFMVGDWDDVQVDFGLKEPDPNKERFVPPELTELIDLLDGLPPEFPETDSPVIILSFANKKKSQAKAKRKQAEKSRKINRKKRKK